MPVTWTVVFRGDSDKENFSEVLIAVFLKIQVVFDVTLCRLVIGCRRFESLQQSTILQCLALKIRTTKPTTIRVCYSTERYIT